MSNPSAVVIDLSGYAFAGEPAYADPAGDLSPQELAELFQVLDEVESEGYADGADQLTDDELAALVAAAEAEAGEDPMYDDDSYAAAAERFDAAFSARMAADARREAARAEFEQLDLIRPAVRSEDRVARVMAKAQAGLYSASRPASAPSSQPPRSRSPTAASARAG